MVTAVANVSYQTKVKAYTDRIRKELGTEGYFFAHLMGRDIADYLGNAVSRSSAENVANSFAGLAFYALFSPKNTAVKTLLKIALEEKQYEHFARLTSEISTRGEYSDAYNFATIQVELLSPKERHEISKLVITELNGTTQIEVDELTTALFVCDSDCYWRRSKALDSIEADVARASPDVIMLVAAKMHDLTYGYGIAYHLAQALYENGRDRSDVDPRKEIFKEVIGNEDTRTGKTLQWLAQSYKREGKKKDAMPDYWKESEFAQKIWNKQYDK